MEKEQINGSDILRPNKKYKDTVFRMLFSDKKELLTLYNAVNETSRKFKLSDAYTHQEENPSLELIVLQLNINPGYNDELMQRCPTLREYMLFVERIRTYRQNTDINTAVNRAVNECIKENILSEFLRKNKREVIAMGIDEYDAELHEKTLLEIGREQGAEQTAIRMLKAGKLSMEEISIYSGLNLEQVLQLKNKL